MSRQVMMHVNKTDNSAPFMVAIATHPAMRSMIEEITRSYQAELEKHPVLERSKEAAHLQEQLTAFFAQICVAVAINNMKTGPDVGETMAAIQADWFFEEYKVHWARMAPMIDQIREGKRQ